VPLLVGLLLPVSLPLVAAFLLDFFSLFDDLDELFDLGSLTVPPFTLSGGLFIM